MTKRIGAGARYTFYGVRDSSGFLIGNTASGATAGVQAGEGMLRLDGGQVIPTSIPENENQTAIGDDEALVSFDFSAATLAQGTIEVAVRDNVFEALVQGTEVQTIGDLSVGVLGPQDQTFRDMVIMAQRRSKKWTAGVKGVKAWEIAFILAPTITPLYNDFNTRQINPYRYSYTTSKTDRKTWGATFTDALNGTTAGSIIVIDSDNPLHVMAWRGNNSQQDFTFDFTPKSSAKIHIYDEGVKQTLTTDYTVSGSTVTFVGTPSSGARLNALYEVDAADLS
jgi:hypothetical protein